MKTVPLSRGKSTTVDDCYYETLVAMGSWYCNSKGYAVRKRKIYIHRLLLEWSGVNLDGLQVDHQNGDRLDNRLSNLRVATNAENAMNQRIHSDNKSGLKGVSLCQGKRWRAAIFINGKKNHLGYFDSAWRAAIAYDKAAKEFFGEYARPNFTNDLGSETFLAAYESITTRK